MDLVTLFVVVVCAGLAFWAVGYFPIAQPFKNILLGLIVLVLILWLLSAVGLVPRLR